MFLNIFRFFFYPWTFFPQKSLLEKLNLSFIESIIKFTIRSHPFSTYAQFPENLIFLIP